MAKFVPIERSPQNTQTQGQGPRFVPLDQQAQQPQQEQFVPFGANPPRGQRNPEAEALAELQGGGLANALWQAYTGGDRQTEETLRTQELIAAEDLNVPADAARAIGFNLATNFDPVEIKAVIEQNLPTAQFRSDSRGNQFVDIDGQEYLINRPGMSKQDIGVAIGNVMANFPAMKLAGLGKSLLRRVAGGAGGSAMTQAAIEAGQASTGGEFTGSEVALAGALGGVGELPAGIRAARMSDEARSLVPRITDAQAEFARRVRATTGVELRPDQVTGNTNDQLVAFMLRNNPETGTRFVENLRKQSSDVYAGVSNLMDELATSQQAEGAANAVRRTSLEAIEQAKNLRAQRTRPLYNRTWSQSAERQQVLDVSDIIRSFDEQADNATGRVKTALEGIQERIAEASVPNARGTNVQRLHNLKRDLFADRDSLRADGVLSNDLARQYEDAYAQIRDRLVQEVPEYEAANNLYRNLSPAVDEISEGIIGNLADVDPNKLKQISNLIFDWQENNANPTAIRNARRVVNEVNPDAWNSLVRNRFERVLGEIGVNTAEDAVDTTENFIQRMYQKAFRGKEKSLMMAAIDGDQRANYNALAEVMDRARNRPGQSATASLQDIRDSLRGNRGGAAGVVRTIMTAPVDLLEGALNAGVSEQRNIEALASVVLDPKWMDRMNEVRRMGMQTPEGGAAFTQLFRDALNDQPQEQQNGNVQGN